MKKYKNVIIYTLLFVILMALAVYGYNYLKKDYSYNENNQNGDDKVLTKATDFRIVSTNGEEVKLSDFFGKPIVVNFWDIGCAPCKAELPSFNNLYLEYGDDVQFLMVNLMDANTGNTSQIKNFVTQNGYEFPVYFDVDYNASMAYSIYSIPRTIFIDKDGNLTHSHIGMMSEDVLKGYIDEVIK